MKYFQPFLRTTWLYCLMGGIYICVNAWVHPYTLPWQLTHLTPWIREDTFGMVCFTLSALAFFGLEVIKRSEQKAK